MTWSDTGGREFEQPPEGPTVGRCVRIIDLGTQDETYKGAAKKVRQVMIGWELGALLMEDKRPFLISKIYTMSLNERANLRSDLENWRGKDLTDEEAAGFDEKVLLGKVCLLNIAYNEKKKAKVASIMPVPKNADGTPSMQIPKQVNESVRFSLVPSEFDAATFDKLTNWAKDKIRKSPEYQAVAGAQSAPATTGAPADDDAIPF